MFAKLPGRNLLLVVAVTAVLLAGSQLLVRWVDADATWPPRQSADVYFLDIGQGDATVIYTEHRQVILIDGGPDLSVLYRMGGVLPFYEKRIDLLVLTHPDSDHMNGLIEVVRRYRIGTVLYNGIADDTPAYQLLQRELQTEGCRLLIAQAGQSFQYGSWQVAVLYPFVSLAGKRFRDTNDSSLVIKASFGQTDWLFTGDLPQALETELVDRGVPLQSEVMKAGHHGSRTSSALEFLQAVQPEYAVVSAGRDNPYGHPHYLTIHHLQQMGAMILRTDLMGTIHLRTDGVQIELE